MKAIKFVVEAFPDPATGKPVLVSDDKRFRDGEKKGLVISFHWLSPTMQKRVEEAMRDENK